MRELINSMMNLSVAMTLFGVQQLKNTVEGVVDATRWTFFTGFTCPDCGAQQEVAVDLRKAMDNVTRVMSSQLPADKQPSYEKLSGAGCDIVNRAFDSVNTLYPVGDDLPPAEDRPAPRRGYEKRPA